VDRTTARLTESTYRAHDCLVAGAQCDDWETDLTKVGMGVGRRRLWHCVCDARRGLPTPTRRVARSQRCSTQGCSPPRCEFAVERSITLRIFSPSTTPAASQYGPTRAPDNTDPSTSVGRSRWSHFELPDLPVGAPQCASGAARVGAFGVVIIALVRHEARIGMWRPGATCPCRPECCRPVGSRLHAVQSVLLTVRRDQHTRNVESK
jgi:hypothetical protein